jgi:hypothetical protein
MAAEKFNAAGNDAVTKGNYEAAVRVSFDLLSEEML